MLYIVDQGGKTSILNEDLKFMLIMEAYKEVCHGEERRRAYSKSRHIKIESVGSNAVVNFVKWGPPNFNIPFQGGYHGEVPEHYFRPKVFRMFNNLELLQVNMEYAKNDGLDHDFYASYYGLRFGPMTERQRAYKEAYTIGIFFLPNCIKRPLTRVGRFLLMPFFAWLDESVHIPYIIMRGIRLGAGYTACGIRLFQAMLELNMLIRQHRLHKFTYDMSGTYWYLLPLRWIGKFTDRYYYHWIWSRIARWPWFGPGAKYVQVRRLTNSPYYRGMALVVGGHRIRWPGIYGFRGPSIESVVPDLVLRHLGDMLWAFSTGRLTVFGKKNF